jgi:hypothetical protein
VIALEWVSKNWHDDNAVAPNKRARRLYDFARENPDRFLVMLERVRQLRGDLGPVKASRAPRGATTFPTMRRVKRFLVPKELVKVTIRVPASAYQQLPEEYRVIEWFTSVDSPDYVVLIESDALSPVCAGPPWMARPRRRIGASPTISGRKSSGSGRSTRTPTALGVVVAAPRTLRLRCGAASTFWPTCRRSWPSPRPS